MFITITGTLGSGKSTVCRVFADKYNFTMFSTGSLLREFAAEKRMSALEFNHYITYAENEIDAYIDEKTKETARIYKNRNVVFDSRLAWFFVPESLKVFLTVEADTAAKRVYGGRREVVENYASEKDALEQLERRKALEDRRFLRLYGVNCNDMNNYDLMLSTDSTTPEQTAEVIYKAAKKL